MSEWAVTAHHDARPSEDEQVTTQPMEERIDGMLATAERLAEACVRLMIEGPNAEWSDADAPLLPFCNAVNESVRAYALSAYTATTAWLGEASIELATLREDADFDLNPFAPSSLFYDLAFACFVAEAVAEQLDELSREDADTDDEDGDA